MDLFEYAAESRKEKESPLAARMRPQTLDEVVGQENIIGKGKLLYRAIKAEFDAGKTVESSVKTGYNKATGAMVDIYAVLLLASIAMLIGVAGVYTMALQAIICVITAAFCSLLWGRVINHMLLSASANKYKYFRFVREDDADE